MNKGGHARDAVPADAHGDGEEEALRWHTQLQAPLMGDGRRPRQLAELA